MFLSHHVWLLAGLIPSLALAQTANLDIWEVHESCKAEGPHVQESMDMALEMAIAAKESLDFLAGPIPTSNDGPTGRLRYNTVYKTVDAVFGLNPKSEGYNDKIGQVKALFNKMVTVMPSNENDPVHGYSTRLNSRNLEHKAMLLCTDKPGDNSWKWYGLEDKVPGMDHKMNQHQDFREMGILNVVEGAWVYEHRFAWKEAEKEEPVLLTDGMLAAVYADKDMVIFGDKLFADPWRSNPSPKALKSSGISVGDAIGKHSSHLSVVMVHELAHWFGGRDNYGKLNIADHTAVTKAGKLLYDNNGAVEEHKTPPTGDTYHRLKTYGRELIWNLARPHKTYPDNSGPAKAITNADSYSVFALMMYLDAWDWSSGGNAKVPGTKRKDPPAP
ncbi:Ff.00g116560.m01.CDS01 [Fusarium sp. VM40]|nr:Ff.00g116560.m01.CDS01 [Fusarium sp. VM40]